MRIERQKILELVYDAIEKAINKERQKKKLELLELNEETYLFGRKTKLDSLELVTLTIQIEKGLTDFGVEISLLNENTISETGPLLKVRSLVDYIYSISMSDS